MSKINLVLVVLVVLQQAFCSWMPKVVWTFWDKPIEQENHLIKALHHNHIQKLGPDWQIKYFDESKFGEWANRIPKLKEAYEHPFWQEFGYTQRINLVKLAILGQEGGVYLDMTLIMTESLDWLLNMTSNPLIENKYGKEPSLFYTYPKSSYREKYFDEETNQSFLIGPSMEMFFIASKANNSYLNEWVSFVVDMKIQTYFQYRLLDKASVFLDIAKKEELELGAFNDKYFEIGIAGIILLARKQDALDKQWNANPNKHRPLIVKDLRIWTADSTKNAYVYFDFNEGFVKPFITTNMKKFQVGNNKMTPFVRFWDEIYRKFLTFLSFE